MKYIESIILNGIRSEDDFILLKNEINRLGELSPEEDMLLTKLITPVLSIDTMQGHAFHKPKGYAGDYEIIDKIYTRWTSNDPTLQIWDKFFHSQEASIAVRNRKKYFIDLALRFEKEKNGPLSILNIGSGPARDVKEFFEHSNGNLTIIDCIELDRDAIEYSEKICTDHLEKVNFINKNIFRYKPHKKYDLIWSAGLFDYFTDSQFVRLLKNLITFLTEDGKVVVGNFSDTNPSRAYMEKFGHWFLNHRSKDKLMQLALNAGVKENLIYVDSEEMGVNLFLHINKT